MRSNSAQSSQARILELQGLGSHQLQFISRVIVDKLLNPGASVPSSKTESTGSLLCEAALRMNSLIQEKHLEHKTVTLLLSNSKNLNEMSHLLEYRIF